MKTLQKNLPGLLFSVLVAASAGTAVQAQSGNGAAGSRSGSANVMTDTAFIGKNMRDNMTEIQLSQLAVERASAPAVQKAAQQLVTDHTQLLNDLTRIGRKNNMPAMAGGSMNGGSGAGSMGTGTSGSGSTAMGATGSGSAGTTGSGATGSGSTAMGATGSGSSGSGSRTGSGGTGTSGSGAAGMGTTGAGNTGGTGTSGSGATGSNAGTSGSGTAIMGNTASGAMGSTGTGMGTQDNMGMSGMAALRNATGAEFDRLWVTQMLSMHEAKLAELTASANTITDPELKAAVTQAIPKIRMHRDLLSKLSTTNTGR